jgi:hypothetical protein
VIGSTRINRKVDLDATIVSYDSYKLNAQSKRKRAMVKCIGACLDPKLD